MRFGTTVLISQYLITYWTVYCPRTTRKSYNTS